MNTVVVAYDAQVKQALSPALFLDADDESTLKQNVRPGSTEAFVIGPETQNPLVIAQRLARVDNQLAVLILPSLEAGQQLRQQRLITPSLGNDVRILEQMDSPQLKIAVEQASSRTIARRRHSKVVMRKAPVIEVWRPDTEVLLDTLLEQLPIGLAVTNPDNRIQLWNQHLVKITGITPAEAKAFTGRGPYEGKHKILMQFIEEFSDLDDTGREFCFEENADDRDPVFFLVSQKRLLGMSKQQGSLLMIQDISDGVRAEKQRINAERNHANSQRLESLGLLAGGIAHDFNNILTVILGNAEYGRVRPDISDAMVSILDDIIFASHRASELTRLMLAYAGKAPVEIESHDLNSVINETHDLLHASINKKANMTLSLYQGELTVELDRVQIGQVLMNLIINASEAIGDGQGEIMVSTGIEFFKNGRQAAHTEITLPAGDYAVIKVRDTGSGMNQKIQQKIFEPFYTTKPTGHGLGLSAVIGIIRAHHGELCLTSELGVGTCFTVHLPLVSPQEKSNNKAITQG